MDSLRAASVAWYVTGRFYVAPDKSTQDLGYFLQSLNVFTASLTWSREFEFRGVRYDLARLLPHGITQWGEASATPLTPAPSGFEKVFAFAGSAIAL